MILNWGAEVFFFFFSFQSNFLTNLGQQLHAEATPGVCLEEFRAERVPLVQGGVGGLMLWWGTGAISQL